MSVHATKTLFNCLRSHVVESSEEQSQFPEHLLRLVMEDKLNPSNPTCLYLISAFLAMEPTDCLISIARECGGGLITEGVQRFICWHCLNQVIGGNNEPSGVYVRNFLKKVIVDVESSGGEVLDELYERFAYYMTSLQENGSDGGNLRVSKTISFLFPDGCVEVARYRTSNKLAVLLQCSLNILEGDTGFAVWPSSLFLSEFILTYPEIFSNKYCFEVRKLMLDSISSLAAKRVDTSSESQEYLKHIVGSGVGLVGICLAYVKASKVVLSDGYMSTLENMKLNLELNQLTAATDMSPGTVQEANTVQCKYLQWESASVSNLQGFQPDIILGADVIYNPSCLPDLIKVLSVLLSLKKPNQIKEGCCDHLCKTRCIDGDGDGANDSKLRLNQQRDIQCSSSRPIIRPCSNAANGSAVAYLATVIRNADTFDYFLKLADHAHLSVVDVTENQKPLNLLPYMRMYDRSSVRLLTISLSHS
ncbi:hypothetical protein Scep_030504 [Stephania cephalantha]|uniref:FAM86 N-terminal domain-containing protein n=1 Tax=Stephania cephalantha TaxID=152367 RepID=A0AAP0E2Y7_9MAGN